MCTERESVGVSNCVAKPDVQVDELVVVVVVEGQAKLLTLVWVPMHYTTQPTAGRDLR